MKEKKFDEIEDKLSKSQTKFLEEMYIERDWTEGRFFDEALVSVDMEIKLAEGYPIY